MDNDTFFVPVLVVGAALAIFGCGIITVCCVSGSPESKKSHPLPKKPIASDPLTEKRDHLHREAPSTKRIDDLPDRRWVALSNPHAMERHCKHELLHTPVENSWRDAGISAGLGFGGSPDPPYSNDNSDDLGLSSLPLPPPRSSLPSSLGSTRPPSLGPASAEEAQSRSRSPPISIVEARSRSRSPAPHSPASFVEARPHSRSLSPTPHAASSSPRMHVPYALRSPARPVPRSNCTFTPPAVPTAPALTPSRISGATHSMSSHMRRQVYPHRLFAQSEELSKHGVDSIPVYLVEQGSHSRGFVMQASRQNHPRQSDLMHETLDFCNELWCESDAPCDCRHLQSGLTVDDLLGEGRHVSAASNFCLSGIAPSTSFSPSCAWRSHDQVGTGSTTHNTWHSRGSGWVRPLQTMHAAGSVDRRNMV